MSRKTRFRQMPAEEQTVMKEDKLLGSSCNQNVYYRSYDENNARSQSQHMGRYNQRSTQDNKQILARHGYILTNESDIGSGRYSKVCTAIQVGNGRKIAIKIIDTREITQEFERKFLPREIQTWKHLRHPNLVSLLAFFEEAGKIFLPMELAERGDLLTYVQQHGPQWEPVARITMNQVLSGIKYMHMHGIAHRDLKLENILVFADNTIKVADFGFCRKVQYGELSITFCGSKSYSAPEILLGHAYSPFKADIWSLGVVAFILVTNRMPYEEQAASNRTIVAAQRNRDYKYPQGIKLSNLCQITIATMMTFDYRARPDIKQTMKLPWFQMPVVPMDPSKNEVRGTTV